jgi:hypothetical protein
VQSVDLKPQIRKNAGEQTQSAMSALKAKRKNSSFAFSLIALLFAFVRLLLGSGNSTSNAEQRDREERRGPAKIYMRPYLSKTP